MSKTIRHERKKILQPIRLRAENDDCDCSSGQVLLILDSLIDGEKDIELGHFRRFEEFAILETGEASVTSGLASMIWKEVPKPFIDTFVNQNAHLRTRK
ncbi:MAG TPA: hypothetical protein VN025_04995 [Candidatus Dormibacteraeota bacterium]|nr:hypothetical protein [Candidatus Dormibacteraeota bacterium]